TKEAVPVCDGASLAMVTPAATSIGLLAYAERSSSRSHFRSTVLPGVSAACLKSSRCSTVSAVMWICSCDNTTETATLAMAREPVASTYVWLAIGCTTMLLLIPVTGMPSSVRFPASVQPLGSWIDQYSVTALDCGTAPDADDSTEPVT